MATTTPDQNALFQRGILRHRELAPRAELIAREASRLAGGHIAIVYILEIEPEQRWLQKACSDHDHSIAEKSIPASTGTLGTLLRTKKRATYDGLRLAREEYAHLNLRKALVSLAHIPLMDGSNLVGAIELISLDRNLSEQEISAVEGMVPQAEAAISSALEYESERNAQFHSIARLTELFDLERVFNSTLQMDRLLPLITSKVHEIMRVQAANIWMVQDDQLILMHTSGDDPTSAEGAMLKSGEGVAAEAMDLGKSILITRADDPRLAKRNGDIKDGAVRSVLAEPISSQGFGVGVIEVINKNDGTPFTEDDFYFMSSIVPTLANALHNASLLEAERKVETLETLVEVSREITSSLNLDRIIQLVVNGPQKMMTYDRASVALEHHGKLSLKAISGKSEINNAEPSVKKLREICDWAFHAEAEVYVVQHGTRVEAEREEDRVRFQEYFSATGMRGFYSVPLADEQGRLGVLTFESRSPDFLMEGHFGLIKILASQTSVALRNASLYTEVPFIGVLEPLLAKKHQFMEMKAGRRAAYALLTALTIAFLAFFPLPLRIVGDATVAAGTTTKIQSTIDGIVKKVYVQEGDVVTAGMILADMDDTEFRTALASAQAKYATAAAAMNRSLASSGGAEAGIQRLELDYWGAEVAHAKQRLEHTRLRATQDGIVTTPHLEDMVGHKLEIGETFATVVNTGHAQIDVAIDEQDVPLVEAGEKATVKVESFPTKSFAGTVNIISPVSTADADKRVFFARVTVPNENGVLRPGMQGRSKISSGWHSAGYVLFRGAAMWAWAKVWNWFGW
jgi:RND family efflux transporter MFP subunit